VCIHSPMCTLTQQSCTQVLAATILFYLCFPSLVVARNRPIIFAQMDSWGMCCHASASLCCATDPMRCRPCVEDIDDDAAAAVVAQVATAQVRGHADSHTN
jgi:hypothetical protein